MTVPARDLAAHFCNLLTMALGPDGFVTTQTRMDLPTYEGREPFAGLADEKALLDQAYTDLGGDPGISEYNRNDLYVNALYQARVARYVPERLHDESAGLNIRNG